MNSLLKKGMARHTMYCWYASRCIVSMHLDVLFNSMYFDVLLVCLSTWEIKLKYQHT